MSEDKPCKNCSNCYDKRDKNGEVVVYLCTVSGIVVDEQVNCKGSLFVKKRKSGEAIQNLSSMANSEFRKRGYGLYEAIVETAIKVLKDKVANIEDEIKRRKFSGMYLNEIDKLEIQKAELIIAISKLK